MSLDPLFRPKSIAVVGASRNREKIGNIILRNLIATYRGKIYPVNNKAEEIEGMKSYKTLKEIPGDVDLAIISVPRQFAVEVMEDAVEKGVKASIVITSGFREVGDEGAKLEEELISTAKKGGIRVLGPNTMGLISPDFNGTFAYANVQRGEIALVVQSGGIGAYMLDWAQRTRTGISFLVSMGNQADVKEYEVIDYLSRDPETRAIFVYLEGVADGEKFLDVVPDAASRKPVVFIKGGATAKGAEAVKTHTGSLAGSYEVFKAAIKTVGGIFVEDLSDFLNLTRFVTSSEPIKGDILVVTNSGGHGVLTSDAISRSGLNMVDIPDRIKDELRKILPVTSLPKNPLDLSGDAGRDRYAEAMKIVQDLDCTKLVIVQSLPVVSCSEVAKVLLNYKGKGVVGVMMGVDEDSALRILESASIPAFNFPEAAVRAIRYLTSKPNPRKKIRVAQPISSAVELTKGKEYLADYEALKLMEIYGIKTPKWGIVQSEEEAQRVADSIGYPVVMKISADKPLHKTEMKGVVMNVEKDMVKSVYKQLSQITKRVMIQEQLTGLEVFVGGLKDPVFGHTVLVGSGGIYVEVLKNVSYGISPVYEDEALEMLKESKVHDMLTARKRGYDEGSLIRTIVTVSRMIVDLNIKEMDINPLIVNENGAFAVDVRILF
ncbi:acetyl coenzyme A synthetase (ADP forming), alpha domain protein [Acidianus hospitalis W1]|uniref:Acetyl coenzyme A synthetase (ADP forming), alpha domain protein n=1 Tax=Acidianus hospitalis (strain W1) TaxID=933801 RepID=F4B8I2_ACIHW|nr:acetate--CoA ligase [Acidianus hospitalis]AEE94934.1 acetyl coenzyme A synthetase (ADP forming), alpha domain protein [Acidianus hospitalis W1]